MRNTLCFSRKSAFVIATVLLSACGSGGDGAGDTPQFVSATIKNAQSCSVDTMNNWVYSAMQDYYLFYDQVDANVNINDYDSPEQLMRALRVQPNDRYSYVTDAKSYNAFFNAGETFGYGWNFASTADGALLFSLIEPNSPLDRAGVQRGEQLLEINGLDIPTYRALSADEKADMIGTADQVRTLELTIASEGQANRQVSVTKASFALQTVLDTKLIEHNGIKVGYLGFYQFVDTSRAELQEAFATLNEAGVSELVLDLRFNGGGRIAVANELSSRIIGEGHSGDVFTTFAHNDKYAAANNVSLYFQSLSDSLSLNRVFVLQSNNTCSASELVVNGLRPFMEVVTIGATSCGKPYATSPDTACGKVANALKIELINADGAGDYFEGIAADCPVAEDVSRALGATDEPLLASALRYVDMGSCALLASRSRSATQKLTTEFKPVWQSGNSL